MSLRFARWTGYACALLILAGCSSTVRVDPPTPEGAAAAACRTLGERLPQRLDGVARVETTPASPYVAVWGEAGIALRCGVPRPATMAATDQVPEIDGVAWFSDPARPLLFTSVGREAYVEVTISRQHTPENVLVDLAAPIKAALP
ncbi:MULTISPECIES: DUF3515 domain-containing protein [Streptosporangium]|jgi:hypothetical protein|uniref:DUF3515 domain-containing protein n=2 Tax=Streptosporangium TaxID=2000 RepID=D2AVL6_STRRD|nr:MULTISPECIES: DUF3515 domain-containing protein [Streptosporangium]ACZ90662.1 hypothetical protein Sros_8007 [Streptosporangium roseum DSM 43021]OUC92047.1 hypothetical protein CA984_31590 [Streptosporangium minutum]